MKHSLVLNQHNLYPIFILKLNDLQCMDYHVSPKLLAQTQNQCRCIDFNASVYEYIVLILIWLRIFNMNIKKQRKAMKLFSLVLISCFALVQANRCSCRAEKCDKLYCNTLEQTISNVELLNSCIDVKPLTNDWYTNCYGCVWTQKQCF
jgi:hypothetical protein